MSDEGFVVVVFAVGVVLDIDVPLVERDEAEPIVDVVGEVDEVDNIVADEEVLIVLIVDVVVVVFVVFKQGVSPK